jgi:hypothetical protein
MFNEFMTWLASQNPVWVFLIFPIIFGSVALSCWRDHLKQKKLEADPIRMTDGQYQNFNAKRMRK